MAPGQPFHAASFQSTPERGQEFDEHTQDFYDLMCVMRGSAEHRVSGVLSPLRAGDITLVRPGDRHSLRVPPRQELYFFNVAFRAAAWHEFGRLAGLGTVLNGWDAADEPPLAKLGAERRGPCERLCHAMVQAYREGPQELQLCRFWLAALGWMLPGEQAAAPGASLPDWLERAAAAMHQEENLRRGLPRLLELSHVSQPHLCRSVRAAYGVSPTELVNDLRLRRAAQLLAETDREVAAIGINCGFENASYFHRCFKIRYGLTPRAYRCRARSTVF